MMQTYSPRNGAAIDIGRNLAGYLLAGYPTRQLFFDTAKGCERNGLTILEVGYPSENPDSDGEVIRRAHMQADISVCHDIKFWQEFRLTIDLPIWLMAYGADLVKSHFYRTLAEERLIDALVIPDIDLPYRKQLLSEMRELEVDVLGFLSPESADEEIADVLKNFPIVYYTLYVGPTGMNNQASGYSRILENAKIHSHKGIFAGFGIQTPQETEILLDSGFAGVIIGTIMIKKLNHSTEALYELVESFSAKL